MYGGASLRPHITNRRRSASAADAPSFVIAAGVWLVVLSLLMGYLLTLPYR
jgi:hypothetical protein